MSANLRKWLARIAFYQRLAGRKTSIPKSIRKQLDASQRDRHEREYLRRLVAIETGNSSGKHRRLEFLDRRHESPSGASKRRLLRSAHEAFLITALESLREIARFAAEQVWVNATGVPPLDATLKRQLEFASWIQRVSNDDRQLLRQILSAHQMYGSDYKTNLAPNQSWLKRANCGPINLSAWLRPRSAHETIEGQAVRIEVATEPREILMMGCYFGTCLSPGECNETSVLANACDANKQVIFAYDEAGRVLARQLVAISSNFELLGYNCYVNSFRKQDARRAKLIQAIAAFCGRWAWQCRLPLGNEGAPEEIGDHFWYDDGTFQWHQAATQNWGEAARPNPSPTFQTTEEFPTQVVVG